MTCRLSRRMSTRDKKARAASGVKGATTGKVGDCARGVGGCLGRRAAGRRRPKDETEEEWYLVAMSSWPTSFSGNGISRQASAKKAKRGTAER